jgi:hypothetical protein
MSGGGMPMSARIARTVIQSVRQPLEGMSPAHLKDIRSLPCIVCGRDADHAHHLMRVGMEGTRGTGSKNRDKWALPFCAEHHDERFPDSIHRAYPGGEEAWLAWKQIDGRGLATVLWSNRGSRESMRRVIVRSLTLRGIYV